MGLGYPYGVGSALTYTPHVIKPVIKEIEVPVKTITYGIKETGCKNFFGFSVPCLAEGEARRKRSADEVAEEKANQREKTYKEQIKTVTAKLKQAEARAEFAEKSEQKLQKEVDRLEDELVAEQEKFKAVTEELEQTFAEMSGY